MGERITVVGGSDSTVAVTLDGAQAITLAQQFVSELDSYYKSNSLNYLSVTDSPDVNDQIGYGVITAGGAYSAGNGYDYIVVGGFNAQNPKMAMTDDEVNAANVLNASVTINSVMNSNQSVSVIGGNIGGFTYNAAEESGKIVTGSVGNNVVFNGNTVNGGNWDIRTGKGDDTITTGSGRNTVYASTGKNVINITAGTFNNVFSEGQDTITASADSEALNSVTIKGGSSSDSHATVSVNAGASVQDVSSYNAVTVGGGSTIVGGTYGNYTFDNSYDSTEGNLNGGLYDSVTASTDLVAIHGVSNTINASQSLSFFNGNGDYAATVGGTAIGFGSTGLNYTLDATGDSSGLFVADVGNETLTASNSTAAMQIYANTVAGGTSNFVAIGGSGDDTIAAGTGNSTFTGGAGNNLFMFSKDSDTDGNTVITDFARTGSENKIFLYNYGLDSDSLATLLKNSSNDSNGNAVLNLDGHSITIEGVSVSKLTVDNFIVSNASSSSS